MDTFAIEWNRLWSARGRRVGLALAVLLPVVLALVYATGVRTTCSHGPVEVPCPTPPIGPDGTAVSDKFFYVHQPLTGDGSITVRLTSLTGVITYPPPDHDRIVPGVAPWTKAGVMIKDGTAPGSSYAALLLTGGHGVRLQHDFVHDRAGLPGGVSPAAPRWLRLTRSGDTLTGAESADGTRWTDVGTVILDELPATIEIGLFVTSPDDVSVGENAVGGTVAAGRLTEATAVFDSVRVEGDVPGDWRADDVGAVAGEGPGGIHHPGAVEESGGTFTLSGNGDVAPLGNEGGHTLANLLLGGAFGLVALTVSAAGFGASAPVGPSGTAVLAARALAVCVAGLVAGLLVAVVVVPLGPALLRAGGTFVLPVPLGVQLRVIVGTALLFGLGAVLALGLGALLRRRAVAVVAGVVLLALPPLLAVAGLLDGPGQWFLRLGPAAAFAIQQTVPPWPQVGSLYQPSLGYYPLAPWAGLAVCAAWAVLTLELARRRGLRPPGPLRPARRTPGSGAARRWRGRR